MQKNILFLATLEILVLLSGYILISNFNTGLHFTEIAIISFVFSILSILTLFIFFRGQTRDPASQTMHSLVAISTKFLVELIFAFIWFIVIKKTRLSSVLLFFILYLTFTLFLVIVMMKTLKSKSLEQKQI